MPKRCRIGLAPLLLFAFFLSCDDNTVGDDFLGLLDLADVEGGAFAKNPTPVRGYAQGKAVDYYDFGAVPTTAGPNDTPVVLAQPMYWFYDRDTDAPLFSLLRNGNDLVRTEDGLAQFDEGDPNRDCMTRYVPPSVGCRPPKLQHPVVGTIPGKEGYTGYWQVIKVRVPKDFVLDSKKGVESIVEAKLEQVPLNVVIHCPVVDLATLFKGSIVGRDRVVTRIPFWYQKQVGNCLLMTGGDHAELKLGLPASTPLPVVEVMMDMKRVPGVAAMHALVPTVAVTGPSGPVSTEVAESRVFEFLPTDTGYLPLASIQPATVTSGYTAGTYKSIMDVPTDTIGDIVEHRAVTVWAEVPACSMDNDPACMALGLACNTAAGVCAATCTDMGGECDPYGGSCMGGFCGPGQGM